MKKQYFSITILALCLAISCFSLMACKPKPQPGPSELASYTLTGDSLFTAYANLDGWTDATGKTYTAEDLALWIDIVGLYESSGLKTNFNNLNYKPGVSVYPYSDEDGEVYVVYYNKDTAGYYVILEGSKRVGEKFVLNQVIITAETKPYSVMAYTETYGNFISEMYDSIWISDNEIWKYCLTIDPSLM